MHHIELRQIGSLHVALGVRGEGVEALIRRDVASHGLPRLVGQLHIRKNGYGLVLEFAGGHEEDIADGALGVLATGLVQMVQIAPVHVHLLVVHEEMAAAPVLNVQALLALLLQVQCGGWKIPEHFGYC